MEDILVPLGFFAMIAAIVIVPRYLKSIERQKLQDTLRASIEKGAELPPEVVQALPFDDSTPHGELIHHPAFGLDPQA